MANVSYISIIFSKTCSMKRHNLYNHSLLTLEPSYNLVTLFAQRMHFSYILMLCNFGVLSDFGRYCSITGTDAPTVLVNTRRLLSTFSCTICAPLWLTVQPPTSPLFVRQCNFPLWLSITNPVYLHNVGGQDLKNSYTSYKYRGGKCPRLCQVLMLLLF